MVIRMACYGDHNGVLRLAERRVMVIRTVCYDDQNGAMVITVCCDQNGVLWSGELSGTASRMVLL